MKKIYIFIRCFGSINGPSSVICIRKLHILLHHLLTPKTRYAELQQNRQKKDSEERGCSYVHCSCFIFTLEVFSFLKKILFREFIKWAVTEMYRFCSSKKWVLKCVYKIDDHFIFTVCSIRKDSEKFDKN